MCMRKIKWLYSIVISTAFMLIVAWFGAFFMAPESEWFLGLFKPDWMVTGGWYTCFTGMTYCIIILLISQLVMKNYFLPYLPILGLIGILTALCPMLFFGFHHFAFTLTILFIIAILNFILFAKLLKTSWQLGVLYLPALVWYSYLFILNYTILMMN